MTQVKDVPVAETNRGLELTPLLQDDRIELLRSHLYATLSTASMTIGITSCDSAAGVSNVAKKLAVCEAQSGRKTLLIDGNFKRQEKQSLFKSLLGTRNNKKDAVSLQQEIVATRVPNLSYLSMDAQQSPSDFELPLRIGEFMDSIRNDYCTVICDLPPVENSIKSLSLAANCDGVLLILNAQSTRAKHARQAIEVLMQNEVQVLGAVLNRARTTLPWFLRRWI
jgi:Mrp family chromosome partitioning ATPase